VTGVLLTAPLIAVWSAGWKAFDLPYPPFDFFDWIARVLPGPVVTRVIDAMVAGFAVLRINPASGAKLVEQAIAVGLAFATGTVTTAIVFALLAVSGEPASLFGSILGAVLGGLVLVMEQSLNRLTSPGEVQSVLWLLSTSLTWGVCVGFVYDHTDGTVQPQADRRRFLLHVGNVAAATTLVGAGWSVLADQTSEEGPDVRWSTTNPLPNAGARVVPVPGTRHELTAVEDHYRVDVDTRAPALSRQRWRLKVTGLAGQSLNLALEELRRMEPLDQFVTLSCISNPPGGDLISTTRWTGVSLQRLLSRLSPPRTVTHIKVTSADGFFEVVSMADIRADPRIMLTYAWDGALLPVEHGRPLRLYIPDRYGMKQPKWIVSLDGLDHWEAGYWVSRGWDREGRVKATAAIDVVAVDRQVTDTGDRRLVPVGGIASAGARGVSRVEVQVDAGEWHVAELREPLSDTTWVLWRIEVPIPPGEHTLSARCFERDGTPQRGLLHSRRITL
jgi:DMSO/TMAO reductase YedYZ molybdopterin-dependent catalytic subunit